MTLPQSWLILKNMSLTPISQKAHDIAHAVFRCARLVANSRLKKELEDAAVNLLANFDLENSLEIRNSKLEIGSIALASPVDKLERLVSLSESIGEMKTVNALVLRRELANLQTAIEFHASAQAAKSSANAAMDDLDISSMFTPLESPKPANQNVVSSAAPAAIPRTPSVIPRTPSAIPTTPSVIPDLIRDPSPAASTPFVIPNSKSDESISSRQENILRLIREIPFCRMRNIMEMMPEVSERTIRNDIQSLIEKQLVRRIGGGGPNSYFESLEVSLRPELSLRANNLSA